MRRWQLDTGAVAAVAVLALITVLTGAPAVVTAVLGIMLVAAPGYVWAEVLLPPWVTPLERAVVAAGLALAFPVIGGLALDAAGIPLHRPAWTALLAGLALIGDGAVLVRRRRSAAAKEGGQARVLRLPAWHTAAYCLAALIAVGAVVLAREGAAWQQQPGFTQLWLTSRTGTAGTASLGVVNHQGSQTAYRLVVIRKILRKRQVIDTWNITLADGQSWTRQISFTRRYPLAAELYRLPDLIHPYRYVTTGDGSSPGS